jgi:hypothetical protein
MDASGLFEVEIVIAPVMWQVGAYENDIAGLEAFDMIACELRAAALVKNDQLHFGMIMPAVVDMRVFILPHAKGVGGGPRDF